MKTWGFLSLLLASVLMVGCSGGADAGKDKDKAPATQGEGGGEKAPEGEGGGEKAPEGEGGGEKAPEGEGGGEPAPAGEGEKAPE